ncbi:MAG: hypothetical protein OQK48_05780 [Sulfurimonas sp.]|nr:hypothetical protein [Sulfurimonas sp.]MCW8895285.1 hypothetical protein [Sulfurimonas sp.]MCW8954438.1 hypothetical protein [Sulfurimonas sp.]MCW9067905.1 hypothetical protein [Sulfurimonas sp.]
MKNLFLILSLILVFTGCSTKEFNEGVDSITSDISRLFEEGKDKSSD